MEIYQKKTSWRVRGTLSEDKNAQNPPFNFIGTPLAETFIPRSQRPKRHTFFIKQLGAKTRVAGSAFEGKIKLCIKVSVFCPMSEEWSNDGPSTVLYDGTAQGCGEQKKNDSKKEEDLAFF